MLNNSIRDLEGNYGEDTIFFEHNATSGEGALWRAVITQALMDAGSNSKKKGTKFVRAQAIAWLAGTTPDFHTVCSLAGLDPHYVRSKTRGAIKRKCKWRKDASRRFIQPK